MADPVVLEERNTLRMTNIDEKYLRCQSTYSHLDSGLQSMYTKPTLESSDYLNQVNEDRLEPDLGREVLDGFFSAQEVGNRDRGESIFDSLLVDDRDFRSFKERKDSIISNINDIAKIKFEDNPKK